MGAFDRVEMAYLKLEKLFLSLLIFLSVLVPFVAQSEEADSPSIPSDFALFDELIASEAEPEAVFLLVEGKPGEIKKYRAWFYDFGALESTGLNSQVARNGRTWLVASSVRTPEQTPSTTFSFFLADEQSAYAATPMRTVRKEELLQSRISESELGGLINGLRGEMKKQTKALDELSGKLEGLKREASGIVDVEKIVDLKIELSTLQNFGTEFDAEEKRLKDLIAFGRSQPDESSLASIRKDLGSQLKETARKTVTADRLAARKKKAAFSRIKNKIATIKSTRGDSLEDLKRKIAAARKKKREFQNRLGKTSQVDTLDF